MTPFRREQLANGVTVDFVDLSNRYFGDYHRVCVEARIGVSVPEHAEPLAQIRTLERMGVPGGEVTAVRDRLVADFWHHAAAYLARADYPARLLAAKSASRRSAGAIAHYGR